MAVIVRGPTAAGKSTVISAIEAGCAARRLSCRRVSLDDGWGAEERRSRPGPASERYRDLSTDEDVVIVELAWGEPVGGAPGATRAPNEWVDLLRHERQVFCIRLSGPKALLVRRRQGRSVGAYGQLEDIIHKHVEIEAGTHRFHGVAGLDELVIPIDNDRPAADIAGAALRHIGLA